MKSTSWALLLALVLSGGACGDFSVPNYNGQSITDLQNGANAAGIGAAAVGLMALSRDFESSSLQSHTALTATFGREGVELDPSNPQHPVDRLEQIGTGEQGYAGWAAGYRLIKQGNVILAALGSATGMTDAQKAGVRGFTRTMQAFAFNRLINVFDAAGLPIAVDIATSDPPAPIATKAQVLAHIGQLLDQANTDLGSAGATFSFNFPAGYVAPTTQGTSFNTPSTFRTFNRALRARNAVYQADYATALTALTASFLNTTASLRFGAYDSYSTGSGDRANPLYDPTCRLMFALPQLLTDAQLQTDGVTLDRRYVTKVRRIPSLGPAPAVQVVHGYSVHSCFTLYPTADSPVPIIRNEELILLRAEARWFTNDKLNALADIDLIRTTSGGLAATSLTIASTDNAFVDELLYNRLYSLMWEGGHRWVDARRFNRLASLPKTPSAVAPTQAQLDRNKVFPYLHLPPDECLPRSSPAASCTAPAGI